MNNLLIQQYGKYKRQQLDENPYSCLLEAKQINELFVIVYRLISLLAAH